MHGANIQHSGDQCAPTANGQLAEGRDTESSGWVVPLTGRVGTARYAREFSALRKMKIDEMSKSADGMLRMSLIKYPSNSEAALVEVRVAGNGSWGETGPGARHGFADRSSSIDH
jgi:hypothetical protein